MGIETMAVMAVASAAYSGYQGYQQQKAADKSQERLKGIQGQSLSRQTKNWDRYKDKYRPLEKQMLEEATFDQPNMYGAVTGASIAGGLAANKSQSSSSVGQNKFLGSVGSTAGNMAMQQAEGVVSSNRAHTMDSFDRKMDALSFGKDLPGQARSVDAQRATSLGALQQQQLGAAQGYGEAALGVPGQMLTQYGQGQKVGDSWYQRKK
jgi:hypothetical protein